jgi:hypothetical protein
MSEKCQYRRSKASIVVGLYRIRDAGRGDQADDKPSSSMGGKVIATILQAGIERQPMSIKARLQI